MKTFWASKVVQVGAYEIKNRHLADRTSDRKLRWSVRKNVRDDGVTSNLYPVQVNPRTIVFRYELEVARKLRVQKPDGSNPPRSNIVSPNRAWRMFAQSLRKYPALPPIVRVANRVYAALQLPSEMLELPREFLDMGWQSCRLNLLDRVDMSTLPLLETKTVLNKMLPWALNYHGRRDGNFAVVRDSDGKMVCTEDGISVAGLRIYHGTTACVLHINADGSQQGSEDETQNIAIPESTRLKTLEPGTLVDDLELCCVKSVRDFDFKGRLVQVYSVRDSSGTIPLTLWGFPAKALSEKSSYILKGVKVQKTDVRFQRGDFPYELHGTQGMCQAIITETQSTKTQATSNEDGGDGAKSPQLALRIDTRCSVASEKSLWEEIKQHFGDGPFDEEKQRRISRAVQGTPVILSPNLRHTNVRVVRFNFNSPTEVPLDPQMRALSGDFHPNQPYAVLHDYSVVPLQVLHCCFDPRMRSWQDVTVPACSFMPKRRGDVLEKFRVALKDGLEQWGVNVSPQPWVTKNLALLNGPEKAQMLVAPAQRTAGQKQEIVRRPKTIAIVSIASPRASPEDREKCIKTAQVMAKHYRTPLLGEAVKEDEALRFVEKSLMPLGKLKDPHSAIICVGVERETRAMRWLVGECLRRGVLPVCLRGVHGDKRQKLLCANVGVQISTMYSVDPTRGLDICKDVPALKGLNVLVLGVDACHTHDITTGACVGLLISPKGNAIFPSFWRNEVRGQEVEQVAENFGNVIQLASAHLGSPLHECVVFQDGNVFSELESMKAKIPRGASLSFMCLHKRTHIRFVHKDQKNQAANVVKGSVVQALTPMPHGYRAEAPSFYLQSHDCFMSTARTVQYTVHNVSPTLPVADLQKLSFVLSHASSPMSTKLPITTRCAHRLSSIAERIIDACPDFKASQIPDNLRNRTWYL